MTGDCFPSLLSRMERICRCHGSLANTSADAASRSAEDFSYFTLVQKGEPLKTLFGISCTRQIDASEVQNKSADVTRSAIQKAVVVITENPSGLSTIREKLSIVTKAWFAQKDFTDCEILQGFQHSIAGGVEEQDNESDNLLSLSLREIIHTFKWQTLVLFKSLLLQPKMLFFGTHCERVCLIQFSLLSLIPGLMRALQDCADPAMDTYAAARQKSTSLRTSDRQSLLSYMGLPLQIFGKGAFFGPYTPLQQLDTLADQSTKSYVVGSTNGLLLQQKDRYADVLVNLDDDTVSVFSTSLKTALALSTADRRWIDFVVQTVKDTWDPQNPSRPSNMGYSGSEEFIRLQFEEYLLALLSSSKYHDYAFSYSHDSKALLTDVEGDPSLEFSPEFVNAWTESENYKLFSRVTDSHLFDVIEPRHPCAGGLTIDDVQRRLAQQVQELHLDEKWRGRREVIGKHFAEGKKHIGGFVSGVWADVEAMREAQRKKAAANAAAAATASETDTTTATGTDTTTTTDAAKNAPSGNASGEPSPTKADHGIAAKVQNRTSFFPHHDCLPITDKYTSPVPRPDLSAATAAASAGAAKAGAYLSSWGAWAAEKRKTAFSGGNANSADGDQPRPNEILISDLARRDAFAAAARSGTRGQSPEKKG